MLGILLYSSKSAMKMSTISNFPQISNVQSNLCFYLLAKYKMVVIICTCNSMEIEICNSIIYSNPHTHILGTLHQPTSAYLFALTLLYSLTIYFYCVF